MISNRGRLAVRISLAAFLCAADVAAQQSGQSGGSAASSGRPLPNGSLPPGGNQARTPMSQQQAVAESGLQNPWDVRKLLTELLDENQQLQPLLANLNPQQWYDRKGAPTTYIIQWQTAQRQLNDVHYSTTQLQQKTESLSLALDLYFRLEALETTTRSLSEGAQRYADRASADKLNALLARDFNSRERLRDYLRDLTTSTEQNFKIADEEAQRCRAEMSRQPTGKRFRKY
jgi:hypothetical protein